MNLPPFRYLLFCLLFLSTLAVHAQGCPEGYEPIVGQGFTGCAPRPDNDSYNQPQQPQQQAQPPPPPPQPQWVTQWGAVATDSVKGVLGTVTGLLSKSEAQQAAMADCRAKGGSPCKFEIAYDNECVAMVVGSNGYNVGADVTVDKAVQLGMKICTDAKNSKCHVYYSACSLPARIQ